MTYTAKPFVFVLMPFNDEFDDIYRLGIKATAEELGTYCERVDEQIFEERILDRIYNQINKADLIIADLTGKNANVFYETGFAHALNKKVILLTQRVEDIPFDLRHHPHIIYEGKITDLKKKLAKRISYLLSSTAMRQISLDSLDFYIEGKKIGAGETVLLHKGYVEVTTFGTSVKLDICNNTSQIYKSFTIGMVLPLFLKGASFELGNTVVLPDKRILVISEEVEAVFPEGWKSLVCRLPKLNNHLVDGAIWNDPIEVELKLFGEAGASAISFKLNISQHWDLIV